MQRNNQTKLFLLLTFIISFSVAGIYKLFFSNELGNVSFTILGTIYMFIPSLSVVIVKKLIYGERLRRDLQISFKLNKWFVGAWLIMPLVAFLTLDRKSVV